MKIDKFNGNLPTVIKGSDAEKFLAKLLKGKLPGNGKPYDLELTRKGKTVTAEVKYSNANYANRKKSEVKRWTWNYIYGRGGKKSWDYLILVGKKDERCSSIIDQDKEESQFVYFLLKVCDAKKVVGNYMKKDGLINLTTDLDRLHRDNLKSEYLVEKCKKTAKELKAFFK